MKAKSYMTGNYYGHNKRTKGKGQKKAGGIASGLYITIIEEL